MSTQSPGTLSPGRAAGLVLMGIAVIAIVLGVITLLDGDGDNGGANPPPTSPPGPTAPPTSEPPPGTGGTGTASPPQPPPPTGNPSAPPTVAEPPPQPPPNPRNVPVRVFNNGTISGLAAQASRDFRGDGWTVVEVGNYPHGIIPTTTVYFRPGTEEEAAARELGARFNMRVEPRFPGIADASPGLIVMITNDYGGK